MIYYHNDIKVVTVATAIRKRPMMYVGPLDNPLLPNKLLQEGLCFSLECACKKLCSSITVELHENGKAVIEDDGPGLPIEFLSCGKRHAEFLMTDLAACRAHKDTENEKFCDFGIVVLNAFCSELSLQTWSDGFEWTQKYAFGQPITEFTKVGPTEKHGTKFEFQLDNSFLKVNKFSLISMNDWIRSNTDVGFQFEIKEFLHKFWIPFGKGTLMPEFNVSFTSNIIISALIIVEAPLKDDAIAQVRKMHTRAQLPWNYKGVAIGAFTGTISKIWAINKGTSSNPVVPQFIWEVSLFADVGISAMEVIEADNATEAESEALVLHNQGGINWNFRGRSIGTFNGPISKVWPISTDLEPPPSPLPEPLVQTLTLLPPPTGAFAAGSSVTLNAHVEIAPDGIFPGESPTGTVDFIDNVTILGTVEIDGSGDAEFITSTLLSGTHPITAAYSGDDLYDVSVSDSVPVIINKRPVTVVMSASPFATETISKNITFTATVTPQSGLGTPSGTVTIRRGDISVGVINLISGTGNIIVNDLPAGILSLNARYNGDPIFDIGVSSSQFYVVQKAHAAVSISTSPDVTAPFSTSVEYHMIVTSPVGYLGPSVPTGDVQIIFQVGTDPPTLVLVETLTPVSPQAPGQFDSEVVISDDTLPVGSYTITAVFASDSKFTSAQNTDNIIIT